MRTERVGGEKFSDHRRRSGFDLNTGRDDDSRESAGRGFTDAV